MGFTLIEILVVLLIVGAGISLVGPRLISTYEGIKASAEEQKLADIVEMVKMLSFFRQVSYTIELEGDSLKVRNEDIRCKFEFIRFPAKSVTFNRNGFPDITRIRYITGEKERFIDVS